MPLLDAALAFAVTMLAVATVVTGIVRFIDWLLPRVPVLVKGWLKEWSGYRLAMFEKMMNEFLKDELKNIIKRELKLADDVATTQATDAINAIKKELTRDEVLTNIANSNLVDKLKQTDLGARLMAVPSRTQEVFDEISRRYTAVEKRYTELFRAKARIVASAVALLLAVAFNIDSVSIANSYLKNPALAASIAARSDGTLKNLDNQIAKATPKAASEESQKLDAVVKQFQDSTSELREQLKKLETSEFPFGWSYSPFAQNKPPWTTYATWLVGLLLTGFLAGLGAPFWHDALRNLTESARGVRSTSASPP